MVSPLIALQSDFMEGRMEAIVATNAFGLGIGRPDIRVIVHFDAPESLDAYSRKWVVPAVIRGAHARRTLSLATVLSDGLVSALCKALG